MATVSALVAAARQGIENLAVEEVLDALGDPEVTIVDVREPAEVTSSGTIPGALCVPRGLLEFRADPTSPVHDATLDPRRRTILYCASGGRSALAAATLRELGYPDVAHLDGGFTAWTDAGLDVHTG